jgi:hypothetical protein
VQTDIDLKEKQLEELKLQLQQQGRRLIRTIVTVAVVLLLLFIMAILR